jgi:putative MATE family efflux protein
MTEYKEEELAQYKKMALEPVNRLIPNLAIPAIISMMISMIYNLVDAYFVGKLGTSASAAIGIMISIQAIFQAIGFMNGHGSGSIISQRLGMGDYKAVRKLASIGFFSSIFMSLIIVIPSLLFLSPLMRFLGSTETILPYARIYGFYILISQPALAASCVMNNILRYEGKAFYAMIGLVSGGVLNMVGDPILMFGFDLGMHGAGLSTAISQYISFFILLFMFKSDKTISTISFKAFTRGFSLPVYRSVLKNGLPSLLRQSLNSISAMTLNISARPFGGDATIAAMAIVGRIMMFVTASMIGIGQGLQPVASYNYGAGKYSRLRDGFFFTWKLGELLMGILALFCFIFPEPLIRIFRDDPDVIAVGVKALRFQCIAAILQPLSMVANMMFQSMGLSKQASFLATLRNGLYYIPILIILPRIKGLAGIQSAQMVADIFTTLTTLPFVINFMRKLPKDDKVTPMDREYMRLKKMKVM